MSELSDNAQSLADTLCGSEFRHSNGVLSRWEMIGDMLVETIRYDADKLREIAAAALELSGEKIEFADNYPGNRRYPWIDGETTATVYRGKKNHVWVETLYGILSPDEATTLAAILLHAASTAREWEGEKS